MSVEFILLTFGDGRVKGQGHKGQKVLRSRRRTTSYISPGYACSLESPAGSFSVPPGLSNEKARLIAQWRRGYVVSVSLA